MRILPLILLLVLSGCGKNLSDMSQGVEAQVPIPRGDGIAVTVGQQWDAVDANIEFLGNRVTELEVNGGGGGGGVTSYNDLTDKPVLGTAAAKSAESTLIFSDDLPTGAAVLSHLGTAATRSAEDVLTDNDIPTGLAVKGYVANVAGLKSAENTWTEPQTHSKEIVTTGGVSSPPNDTGFGFITFSPKSSVGVGSVGIGSQSDNNNNLIYQLPAEDPADGQGIAFHAPVSELAKDGTTKRVAKGYHTATSGVTKFADLQDTQITLAELGALDGIDVNIKATLLDIQAQLNTLNGTPTVPTLTEALINNVGNSLTLSSGSLLDFGAGGNGGVSLNCATTGNGIGTSYASGSGTNNLIYTIGTSVLEDDTCYLIYTQPGDGIERDDVNRADLASITGTSFLVNNQSTYVNGGGLYLYEYDFSEIGIPADWGLLGGSGPMNWDYDGTSIGMPANSIKFNDSGTSTNAFYSATATLSTSYHGLDMYLPALPGITHTYLRLYNSADSQIGSVEFRNNGAIIVNVTGGTSVYSDAGALTAATPMNLKLVYVDGGGVNSTFTVFRKIGGTWTQLAQASGGTASGTVNWIRAQDGHVVGMVLSNVRGGNENF